MKLTYKSEGGSFDMGGGDNPFINITMMNGFELPAPDYETVKYSGQSGQTTTGKTDLPRIMTITGDLMGGQLEIMSILKTVYYPGELYCDFGQVKRKIACKCTNQDDINRHMNSGINGFTFQFVADNPYFSDFYDTEVNLAAYVNHVTDTFTLPCVFTELINEGSAYNRGDLITYPIITLTANSSNQGVTNTSLTINNLTTGKTIKIKHSPAESETVTIDIPARKILSSVSGKITKKLVSGIDMSKFYLAKGVNKLSFSTTNTQQPITAQMSFNNVYIMAVR